MLVWRIAGGSCSSLLAEARPDIPAHPSCQCTILFLQLCGCFTKRLLHQLRCGPRLTLSALMLIVT